MGLPKPCRLFLIVLLLAVFTESWAFDRASESSIGVPGDNASYSGGLNGDGRFEAFSSLAQNLVPGVVTGESQVYVKDRATDDIECVSLTSAGEPPNGLSSGGCISWDGRYVVFTSTATNLAPVSPASLENAFVFDRLTKIVEQVNVSPSDEPGNGGAIASSISGDGRFIVFSGWDTNLIASPVTITPQVYVRDMVTGTTEIVSVNDVGEYADQGGSESVISEDGRWLAYVSASGNLAPGVPSLPFGWTHVYRFDRLLRTVQCLSMNGFGTPGNNASRAPSINGDGSVVVFSSNADNLVSPDINGTLTDVFLFDKDMGGLELASKDESGVQQPFRLGYNDSRVISADGLKVVYQMDWPAWHQVYLWDRITNSRQIISRDDGGTLGNNYSDFGNISADGNCIAFTSSATNLLVPDGNGSTNDVYVTCLSPPVWPTDTPTVTLTQTASPTYSPTSTPTTTATITTPTPDCRNGHPTPPVIYPNPAKDRVVVQVRSSLCRNTEWMKIKIYTTSFRKLAEISFGPQPAGVLLTPVELRDGHGTALADGLYYLTVETPYDQSVGKLMVLH